MRYFKYAFIFLLVLFAITVSIYYVYFHNPFAPSTVSTELYELETPEIKGIKQTISTTGKLKLKDQVDIGSVVEGRIKKIYITENEHVKEGQLLVEIETGVGDTEVREAEGAYERAIAELEFHETTFRRKKQLFGEHFLSDADLEEAKMDYLTAVADVKALKASYDKKVIAFENNKVYAPTSGVIIQIDVKKGEKVSSDLKGGELLSIVPNIQHIEAELEIDEKDIGQIKEGQNIQMVVETYPNRIFKSTIHHISYTAKCDEEKRCAYLAKAYLDNPNLLLRPGMSVHATIDVASNPSALTLTSRAFHINRDHLLLVSELSHIPIQSIDEKEKEVLLESNQENHLQFIWILSHGTFKEIPIQIGITDHISFEILSGLTDQDQVVVDIMENDEMKKIYDQIFRKL